MVSEGLVGLGSDALSNTRRTILLRRINLANHSNHEMEWESNGTGSAESLEITSLNAVFDEIGRASAINYRNNIYN